MIQEAYNIKYTTVNITSLDGEKSLDLTQNLLETNYFEDLLEPCVSATLSIVATYDIVEGLPIRGGEKVEIDLETKSGKFKQEFFVYKVSDVTMEKQKTSFVLHLVPVEYARNELASVGGKFQNLPIDVHVRDILTDVLKTKRIGVIENTSNSISFYGNLRKPFYLLRWLGPKSEPIAAGKGAKGEDTSKNDDSKDKPINDPKWQKTIPVIGTSYCHSRQFQVDDITHSVLNQFVIAKEKVAQTHEQMFEYIYAKVSKIEQGLKTYTKYSQAKELFDKLGIPLNESQIDEQSSMALSVFSPETLADMLTDKDEEFASREEKIAHFKALANATVN